MERDYEVENWTETLSILWQFFVFCTTLRNSSDAISLHKFSVMEHTDKVKLNKIHVGYGLTRVTNMFLQDLKRLLIFIRL